jgi:small-conductance mechanosensitive channel
MMDFLNEIFQGNTVPGQIALSVAAVVILTLIAYFLIRLINKRVEDFNTRHKSRKAIIYAATTAILIILVAIWFRKLQQFGVAIGIFTAAIALALSNAILCFVGWIYILMRRPFDIGDRIEVEGTKGDVIDIRIFHTILLEVGNWSGGEQSTGRMLYIPNSVAFTKNIFNYTLGFPFIWNEINVTITFESNWQKAKDILLKHGTAESEKMHDKVSRLIKKMVRSYPIYFRHLTPIVYTKITESGVTLELRYLTNVRERRGTETKISEAILRDFNKQPDVDFAYPTKRIVGVEPK